MFIRTNLLGVTAVAVQRVRPAAAAHTASSPKLTQSDFWLFLMFSSKILSLRMLQLFGCQPEQCCSDRSREILFSSGEISFIEREAEGVGRKANTWGVHVLRSPNFFFSGMEADRNVKVVG